MAETSNTKASLPRFRNANELQMAKISDDAKAIIGRLKSEGAITRNAGPNSLKSIRIQLEKFGPVLQEISSSMDRQHSLAEKTQKLQIESLEAEKRQRLHDSVTQEETGHQGTDRTGSQGLSPVTSSKPGPDSSGSHPVLDKLLGVSKLHLGVMMGSLGAAILGTSAFKSALMVAAIPIGAALGAQVKQLSLDLGADVTLAENFGKAANLGAIGGMVGLAFGKKFGLLGAAAGVTAGFGEAVSRTMGFTEDDLIAGMKVDTLVSGVMGAVGLVVSGLLTSKSFYTSLGSLASNSVGFIGAKNSIRLGVSAAIATAAYNYSNDFAEWITGADSETDTLTRNIGNVAEWSAYGTSIGMMFGPKGAIVGAIAGFAIGLGAAVVDWMSKSSAEASRNFADEADRINSEATSTEDYEKSAALRVQELNRSTAGRTPGSVAVTHMDEETANRLKTGLADDIEGISKTYDGKDVNSATTLVMAGISGSDELWDMFTAADAARAAGDMEAVPNAVAALLEAVPALNKTDPEILKRAIDEGYRYATERASHGISIGIMELDNIEAMTDAIGRKSNITVELADPKTPSEVETSSQNSVSLEDVSHKPKPIDEYGKNIITENAINGAPGNTVNVIDKSSNVYAPSITNGGSTQNTTITGNPGYSNPSRLPGSL